jgi:hypothetical protein
MSPSVVVQGSLQWRISYSPSGIAGTSKSSTAECGPYRNPSAAGYGSMETVSWPTWRASSGTFGQVSPYADIGRPSVESGSRYASYGPSAGVPRVSRWSHATPVHARACAPGA